MRRHASLIEFCRLRRNFYISQMIMYKATKQNREHRCVGTLLKQSTKLQSVLLYGKRIENMHPLKYTPQKRHQRKCLVCNRRRFKTNSTCIQITKLRQQFLRASGQNIGFYILICCCTVKIKVDNQTRHFLAAFTETTLNYRNVDVWLTIAFRTMGHLESKY